MNRRWETWCKGSLPVGGVMRRWQFSIRSMLLVTAIAAILLVPAVRFLRVWQSFASATVSVRVTSSGTVKFGNEEVPVEECLALLAGSAQSLRSHGLKPDLLIEAYSNTRPSDVETVLERGMKAGFEWVKTERLAWPDNVGEEAAEDQPGDDKNADHR